MRLYQAQESLVTHSLRKLFGTIALASAVGCSTPALAPPPPCNTDVCDITGRVLWFNLEGGFWAIRGDDQVSYDPINLPAEFREDGLRVVAALRLRRDLGGIHMVGPIVEVLSIRRQ
jgi:hypothetical protein